MDVTKILIVNISNCHIKKKRKRFTPYTNGSQIHRFEDRGRKERASEYQKVGRGRGKSKPSPKSALC